MILLLTLLCAIAAGAVDAVQEGRRLYANNQFETARSVLFKAVRANPSNVKARLWLAYTYLALSDLEPALRELETLEKSCAHDPEYLFAMSEASTRRARELSERLASLGDVARAHQLLAYRYKLRGDWQIAIVELRRAAQLRPGLAGVHLDAAEILWDQKQYDDAAKELEMELKLSPLDFLANLRYGQHLLRTRRFQEAARYLETAARFRKYPEAHLLLAFAWERIDKPEAALAVLNSGLAAFPDNRDLSDMRARLLRKPADLKTSAALWRSQPLEETKPDLASLRSALAREPTGEDALFRLSRLYAERGEIYHRLLESAAPDSYRTWQIKGLQAESAGDLVTAESCYRKAIEKQPHLPGAHFALGLTLQKLGRMDESIQEYEAELRIDPNHYLACYELGSGLARRRDFAAGIPWLERAVKLKPAFIEAKVELAKADLESDRPTAAIPILSDVISVAPDHSSAHYLLYRAYKATGARDQAQQQLAIHQKLLRN